MTPPPTTTRLAGTFRNSSAPVDETITFSSISTLTPGMPATSEPVAMTMFFASISCDLAVLAGHRDLAGGNDLAGAAEGIDLVLLEQEGDAIDVGGDRRVLVRQHLCRG